MYKYISVRKNANSPEAILGKSLEKFVMRLLFLEEFFEEILDEFQKKNAEEFLKKYSKTKCVQDFFKGIINENLVELTE